MMIITAINDDVKYLKSSQFCNRFAFTLTNKKHFQYIFMVSFQFNYLVDAFILYLLFFCILKIKYQQSKSIINRKWLVGI